MKSVFENKGFDAHCARVADGMQGYVEPAEFGQDIIDQAKTKLAKGQSLTADDWGALRALGIAPQRLCKSGQTVLRGFDNPGQDQEEDLRKSRKTITEDQIIRALDKIDQVILNPAK